LPRWDCRRFHSHSGQGFRAHGHIGKLNAAAVQALADPAVCSRLVDLGYETFPGERQTPEALGAPVKADAVKWWANHQRVGDQGGITLW
jgi:hypothetical protein